MKKLTQGVFLRTALILALTVALSISFASGVFAAVADPANVQISAADATVIPSDILAPSVAHSVAPLPGANPYLPFPYQLNLVGMNTTSGWFHAETVSFQLFIVDSDTREVVTTRGHMGPDLPGDWTVDLSPCGEFIEVLPVDGFAAGRVVADVIVLLQHGQEVVIKATALPGYSADWAGSSAVGLVDMDVLSFFWHDPPPASAAPPTPGFTPAHKNYTFHLDNPFPGTNPLAPPQHFHGGSIDPVHGEGFVYWSHANMQTHILANTVRVEAVWTLDGVTATVPLTKALSVETTNPVTVPDITFEFEFSKVSFNGSSDTATKTANMPVIDNQFIPTDGDDYTANTVAESILDGVNIVFDRPGIFVYEVKEIQIPGATASLLPEGMTPAYSDAVYLLTIVVEEDDEGALVVTSVTITVEVPDASDATDELIFTNVLTYVPILDPIEPSEVTTTVPLTKILSVEATTPVDVPATTFEFAFEKTEGSETTTVTADLSIPVISNTTTTTVSGNIDVDFSFDTTGTFIYRVTEVPDTNATPPLLPGMTVAYSGAVYELIIVVIEDDEGALVVTSVTITAEVPDASDATDELIFTNILTFIDPPTCPECGETPPCDICDECGRPECACTCDPPPPTCPECGETPPCDICDECGRPECACTCDAPTGPQEEGEGEGEGEGETPAAPTTPTPPRGDGRDPAPVGPKTGDWSNPSSHLLHMLAAAVLMVVVLYRLSCSSEALARRKS